MTWLDLDKFTAEVGKTYRVEWDDCCTSGFFVSTLTEIVIEPGDDCVGALVFEHGEVHGGHVTLTEVAVSA